MKILKFTFIDKTNCLDVKDKSLPTYSNFKTNKIRYIDVPMDRKVYAPKINEYFKNAKREKFCLENADGLCCRMFETQYLKQKYHYQNDLVLFYLSGRMPQFNSFLHAIYIYVYSTQDI